MELIKDMTKRNKIWIVVAGVLSLYLVCHPPFEQPSSSTSEYRGAVLALTDRGATYGERAKRGNAFWPWTN